jgi:hypothetical protein
MGTGLGLRIFLVDENDALIKVSIARWNRLFNDHQGECFPEHAGKKLRYILAVLELHNKKPDFISHIDCAYITFDSEGKLDRNEFDKQMHLAVESAALLEPEKIHANVIMAEDRFAKKTYRHTYKWNLPDGMLDRLIRAIFT